MPHFVYEARDTAQRLVRGRVEADSERAALTLLGQQGVYPLALEEEEAAPQRGARRRGRRVGVRERATFLRQLANLLGAGLPLLSALNLLGRQSQHPQLRLVIADVV